MPIREPPEWEFDGGPCYCGVAGRLGDHSCHPRMSTDEVLAELYKTTLEQAQVSNDLRVLQSKHERLAARLATIGRVLLERKKKNESKPECE